MGIGRFTTTHTTRSKSIMNDWIKKSFRQTNDQWLDQATWSSSDLQYERLRQTADFYCYSEPISLLLNLSIMNPDISKCATERTFNIQCA
jgi:hypothetical protein